MMTEKTTDQKELYAQIAELQTGVARAAESMVKTAQAAEFLFNAFNALDEWRHFPAYQLERRVDVFFALLLPQIVEAEFGLVGDKVKVIPEFPLRKGTLNNSSSNHSTKVDFAVFGHHRNGGKHLILVELKTDNNSIIGDQLSNLDDARGVGVKELVNGVVKCACHSEQMNKYYQLILKLSEIGCIDGPGVIRIMKPKSDDNFYCHVDESWSCAKIELALIYPGPKENIPSTVDKILPDCLNLVDFCRVVQIVGDNPLSSYLTQWGRYEAGNKASRSE